MDLNNYDFKVFECTLYLILAVIFIISIIVINIKNTALFFREFNENQKKFNIIRTIITYCESIILIFLILFVSSFFLFTYPEEYNLIFINVEKLKSEDKTDKVVEDINTLTDATNSKLVLITNKTIIKEYGDIQVIGHNIGLKAEILDSVPILPDQFDDIVRIQIWLKNIDLRFIKNLLIVSEDFHNTHFDELRFRDLIYSGKRMDYVITRMNSSKQEIKIGEIKICESTIKQEMSFGGQKVQKIL